MNNISEMQKDIALVREIILTMPRVQKAHVRSYGCQLNFCDGDKLKSLCVDMGYELTDTPEEADLIIFNTCAVRENAEDRAFGNIGFAKHIKEKNPETIIGLCGCMAQQEHSAKKIAKSYPFVDIVFGTHVIHRLPEFLYRNLSTGKKVYELPESDGVIAEEGTPEQIFGNPQCDRLKTFLSKVL